MRIGIQPVLLQSCDADLAVLQDDGISPESSIAKRPAKFTPIDHRLQLPVHPERTVHGTCRAAVFDTSAQATRQHPTACSLPLKGQEATLQVTGTSNAKIDDLELRDAGHAPHTCGKAIQGRRTLSTARIAPRFVHKQLAPMQMGPETAVAADGLDALGKIQEASELSMAASEEADVVANSTGLKQSKERRAPQRNRTSRGRGRGRGRGVQGRKRKAGHGCSNALLRAAAADSKVSEEDPNEACSFPLRENLLASPAEEHQVQGQCAAIPLPAQPSVCPGTLHKNTPAHTAVGARAAPPASLEAAPMTMNLPPAPTTARRLLCGPRPFIALSNMRTDETVLQTRKLRALGVNFVTGKTTHQCALLPYP